LEVQSDFLGEHVTPRIVYLHGFRSSPASLKVRLLAEYLAANGRGECFSCPALSPVPNEAIAQAEALLDQADGPVTLVGSSLGGYYASYLAEKHHLRAVLINPLVETPPSLAEFLGRQTNLYTGESFEFTLEHVEQLRALEVRQICAERYLLMVETGDKVLDYRLAVARYAGCQQVVLAGGDHSFRRFPEFLPKILEFCRL
jgi:hypothetical protein